MLAQAYEPTGSAEAAVHRGGSIPHGDVYSVHTPPTAFSLQVFLCSMGREPVSVNSAPVLSPVELTSGDRIEVHLEGRSRVFFFHGVEDTVQIGEQPPLERLAALTSRRQVPRQTRPALSAAP